MMNLSDLWRHFRLLTDLQALTEKESEFMQSFLAGEYRKREQKRIAYLMKMSGIKRIKRMDDFDWTFNPKVPRDKIMELINTDWLKKPCNLVIVGPAGVGKTHMATALCHDALIKGHQTVFVSLFDLTAKLSKARNVYSLIDYYAKVPILCLDELGYVVPTKEQADSVFQIISKRTEIGTTIITTNLIPSHWGKIFDSGTASAILDRLSMNGRFITFEGRSYRGRK
jgi:DNA replication protein DnaC